MAVGEQLPFPVGSTAFGSGLFTPTTADLTTLEGREYWVEDVHPTTKVRRSNRRRLLRVVRNSSTVPLYPKQLVTFKSGITYGAQVDGYADLGAHLAEKAFPVDEYLSTSGCPVSDLCYIVVKGPAICLTQTAADATGSIAVGDVLVAATGANSTASITAATTSTGGKVCALTTNTTFQALAAFNSVGVALTARTSAQTATDILVEVGRI